MNSRHRQLDAILFRKNLFGEADFRLEIYSPQGYETIFAFGAAKEKSKKRGLLESGNLFRCSLARKTKDSPSNLREIRLLWYPSRIFTSLYSASQFYFLMESLSIILRHHQDGIYFKRLSALLQTLENLPDQQALSLAFILSVFATEGHLSPSINLSQLEEIAGCRLQIGKGSMRFIQDALQVQDESFWIHQSMEKEVEQEILTLIHKLLSAIYKRPLHSIKLFNPL